MTVAELHVATSGWLAADQVRAFDTTPRLQVNSRLVDQLGRRYLRIAICTRDNDVGDRVVAGQIEVACGIGR